VEQEHSRLGKESASLIELSAVIITFNEEKNIERCIRSVAEIADEILVVDSFSSDRTEQICREYGVTFVNHPFEGHIEQKNWALGQTRFNHVLSLDADEVVSDELKRSIMRVKENWSDDGYCFNRLTNYCGQWIKHCGWYPDRKLRLFDKRKGRWGGVNPHDKFILRKGSTQSHLKGDLLHYSYATLSEHVKRIDNYSTISAREMHMEGLRATTLTILSHSAWRFFSDYFLKFGFLDGYNGFLISMLNAYLTLLKYAKLKEMHTNETVSPA
jgi:glycosyltransferase involved in cell wall biosynthesis